MSTLSAHLLDQIASNLTETGACVLPDLIPSSLVDSVVEEISEWRESFRQASIGKSRELHPEIRSDRTLWWDFERLSRPQMELNRLFQGLKEGLNERLYLGLWDQEGHYAVYPPGAYYRTHVDRFSNDSARVLSVVVFFNRGWIPQHGGELRLELSEGARLVLPVAGSIVLFLSDRIPHEVLPTHVDRLSFAGWFRKRL